MLSPDNLPPLQQGKAEVLGQPFQLLFDSADLMLVGMMLETVGNLHGPAQLVRRVTAKVRHDLDDRWLTVHVLCALLIIVADRAHGGSCRLPLRKQ